MSTPDFSNIRPQRVTEIKDKTAGFAFNNVENGAIVFLSDDKRLRSGKFDYDQYVAKVGGTRELQLVTGATGSPKGGSLWIDPNDNHSNRSRIIFVYNNTAYLYSITNDAIVELYDFDAIDGYTVSFFNGVQPKKKGLYSIGDSTTGTNIWVYNGTSTGSITAFADYSGTVSGTVSVSSSSHGMQTGNTVDISGTTNYNGKYVITKIDANTFYITHAWNGNDATGTWSGETLTKTPQTALGASRLLGIMENRLISSGVGDNSDKVDYSVIDSTGTFGDFTDSTDLDGGGNLAGILDRVTALKDLKGTGYVFERDRITPHLITSLDAGDGTGRIKDTQTLLREGVVDGNGVDSAKAVTVHNNRLYWVNKRGIFSLGKGDDEPKEITKGFRPLFGGIDLSNPSVVADAEQKNRLIITCSSQSGVANDFQLIWSFDSETLSFVTGKYSSQLFYDPVSEKIFGLGSTKPQILEFYGEGYVNEDENVKIIAETRMDDMEDEFKNKRFVSVSFKVGAVNSDQEFLSEIFVDNNTSPSATFTRSCFESDNSSGVGTVVPWGGNSWSSQFNYEDDDLIFFTIFWEGFVPNFEKISLRITEDSPYFAVVGKPVFRFTPTGQKINSFSSRF